ncbi:ABC transporter ATP-binding protein [termite gut metagenome]|uniref:ABC transporter ATP-binding protein n=1 Tax=termite gut metagenome TaxID=433724 RepID=A0A5J4RPG6_9ZZZZ
MNEQVVKHSLVEIRSINRIYYDTNGKQTVALQDVSMDIKAGEFISFIGPSGCGKTTLLRLIAGLDSPQGGSLLMENKPIDKPGHERGYVFQHSASSTFPVENRRR